MGQRNILFSPIPSKHGKDKSHSRLRNVAYWPEGPALCLFFGPTLSNPSPNIIKPYSPVNVIGKILGDAKILEKVNEGEKLKVENFKTERL